jgi:uncharacterized protein YutE (UPF0331/DUF86 family)
MVDVQRLRDLLDRLGETIAELRSFAELSDDDVLSDAATRYALRYLFIEVIHIALDIAHHVIASERLAAPQRMAGAFDSLADGDWISPQVRERLVSMTRFRNLLVHRYADVDDHRVLDVLRTRLDDLEAYRRELAVRALSG